MKIFAFLSKIKERFVPMFKNKNKTKLFLYICIFLLIVIFAFPLFFKKDETNSSEKIEKKISVTEYSKSIELKLETMLQGLSEVTSVSAMVMVDSSPKVEYLTEIETITEITEKGSSKTEATTVVFEKDGSISTPIVITTIMPKITGVLLVLNDISASTKYNIINSVSIVLNIDSSCISILQES